MTKLIRKGLNASNDAFKFNFTKKDKQEANKKYRNAYGVNPIIMLGSNGEVKGISHHSASLLETVKKSTDTEETEQKKHVKQKHYDPTVKSAAKALWDNITGNTTYVDNGDLLTDLGGTSDTDTRTSAERNSDYWHPVYGANERWKASMANNTNPVGGLEHTVVPAALSATAAVSIPAAPGAFVSNLVTGGAKSYVGAKAVDAGLKATTGQDWAHLSAPYFGTTPETMDFFHPGYLAAGIPVRKTADYLLRKSYAPYDYYKTISETSPDFALLKYYREPSVEYKYFPNDPEEYPTMKWTDSDGKISLISTDPTHIDNFAANDNESKLIQEAAEKMKAINLSMNESVNNGKLTGRVTGFFKGEPIITYTNDIGKELRMLYNKFMEGTLPPSDNTKLVTKATNYARQADKAIEDAKLALKAKELHALKNAVYEDNGIEWNAIDWFRGRQGVTGYTPQDVEIFTNHVKNEYLPLGNKLINSGKLLKVNGKWMGEINGKLVAVNPNEYIVANSEAFKNAGLYYDGTSYWSGMEPQHAAQLRKNGGLGVFNWTSDNAGIKLGGPSVTTAYGNVLLNLTAPEPHPAEIINKGPNGTSNHYLNNVPVGSFTLNDRTTIFPYYYDELSHGMGTTRVISPSLQVKTIRGNNGDFNMDKLDPFAYNNQTQKEYENYVS